MAAGRGLFDRELMLEVLRGLDERLDKPQRVVVVGGSYLALAELRESTRDVDVATRLTDATRRAVEEVAAERGLAPRWLNDDAAVFLPKGLTEDECESVFDGDQLTVVAPSADWIFLMKLYAARAVDRADMVRLWPYTGFDDVETAIERYKDAYPYAPADEDLPEFLADIAAQAHKP